jgi:hypothetical protein
MRDAIAHQEACWLLRVVTERAPGLVVFGPDGGRTRGRTYREATRLLPGRASCLGWLAE